MPWRTLLTFILGFSLLCGLIILSLSMGSAPIDWRAIWDNQLTPEEQQIIMELRLPRAILAILVGASLASSGFVLQGLLRNPLVDSYLIGLSAGGSLGAAIALLFHWNWQLGPFHSTPLAAFGGALLSVSLVYALASRRGRLSPERFLLAGIAVSAFLSALLSLLLVLNGRDAQAVIFWVMGSLAGRGWAEVQLIWPYLAIAFAFMLWHVQALNAFKLGEEGAAHLGIAVPRVHRLLIFATSLATAACVSVSGVIGFVGLMIPHLCRLLLGAGRAQNILPLSMIFGAVILLGADTMARTWLAPQELPVGILTALLGVPCFLFFLRKS